MLVVAGLGTDELPGLLLASSSRPPGSGPSPDSGAIVEDSPLSLSPPTVVGNEPLVVAATTADVEGTELESPSRRTKFTYALTNPVELNFGKHMGSHDAEAELL